MFQRLQANLKLVFVSLPLRFIHRQTDRQTCCLGDTLKYMTKKKSGLVDGKVWSLLEKTSWTVTFMMRERNE